MALAGDQVTRVLWQAVVNPTGLTVSPSSGTLTLAQSHGDAAGCAPPRPSSKPLSVTAPVAGSYSVRVNLSTTSGVTLPPVVVDVDVQP